MYSEQFLTDLPATNKHECPARPGKFRPPSCKQLYMSIQLNAGPFCNHSRSAQGAQSTTQLVVLNAQLAAPPTNTLNSRLHSSVDKLSTRLPAGSNSRCPHVHGVTPPIGGVDATGVQSHSIQLSPTAAPTATDMLTADHSTPPQVTSTQSYLNLHPAGFPKHSPLVLRNPVHLTHVTHVRPPPGPHQ
jgi:hypothetical protein